MSKARIFPIVESIEELTRLHKKQTKSQYSKRVYWLKTLKVGQFKTRKELSDYIGISRKTQERWIKKYIDGGIDNLLSDEPKNKKSKIITAEIHKGLSDRVNDSKNPFLGYWDAQQWVEEKYGIEVKYHFLRYYLIQHFNTKLKSPRKSHYKKDKAAVDEFLKNFLRN